MTVKVLVHIVTYNHAPFILAALESVLAQRSVSLRIEVTDNASTDGTPALVVERFGPRVTLFKNQVNLGFCGAHNQGVKRFLDGGYEYLLILNPDVALEPDFLALMCSALAETPQAGTATPRLYRADDQLKPVMPRCFDAAGMYLDNTLRHFDRGSQEVDSGQYREREAVFGGTGAALMLSRMFAQQMILSTPRESDVDQIYPQLAADRASRALLFDEAFFAYREDAELAWRAQNRGWQCLYVPEAIGHHRRVVLPERRASLPPELNAMSVRNRFLMQVVNYRFSQWRALIPGLLCRNLLVLLGVLLRERSSLPALLQALKLLPRALQRRRIVSAIAGS